VREPAPLVVTDELDSFTPCQVWPSKGDDAHLGKNVIDQDLSDATNLSHHSSKESDKEEMLERFGYLSEGDPNFQKSLDFVVEKLPRQRSSVLGDGSGEEDKSAIDHEVFGESGMFQEGHPSKSFDDEFTEVLKTLSSGNTISSPLHWCQVTNVTDTSKCI
jgi:hypothetical protein